MAKNKEKVMAIDVKTILESAVKDLQQVAQWRDIADIANIGFAQNVVQYASAATALVELVEVHHCGSVGGFGEGQTHEQRSSLIARINYLADYYGIQVLTPDQKNIVEQVRIVVDKLAKNKNRHVMSWDKVSQVLTKEQRRELAEDLEAAFDLDIELYEDVKEYFGDLKHRTIEEMAIDLFGYTAKDRYPQNEDEEEDDTDEDEDNDD